MLVTFIGLKTWKWTLIYIDGCSNFPRKKSFSTKDTDWSNHFQRVRVRADSRLQMKYKVILSASCKPSSHSSSRCFWRDFIFCSLIPCFSVDFPVLWIKHVRCVLVFFSIEQLSLGWRAHDCLVLSASSKPTGWLLLLLPLLGGQITSCVSHVAVWQRTHL